MGDQRRRSARQAGAPCRGAFSASGRSASAWRSAPGLQVALCAPFDTPARRKSNKLLKSKMVLEVTKPADLRTNQGSSKLRISIHSNISWTRRTPFECRPRLSPLSIGGPPSTEEEAPTAHCNQSLTAHSAQDHSLQLPIARRASIESPSKSTEVIGPSGALKVDFVRSAAAMLLTMLNATCDTYFWFASTRAKRSWN